MRISRLWCVPFLALALGLAAQTARAEDVVTTLVSVYGPGASLGAAVAIQAQNGGGWTTVDRWKGYLTGSTVMGVLFTRWELDAADLGQGPYRAVVFSLDQKSLVAVSDPFYMPILPGTNFAVTVGGPGVQVGTPPAGIQLDKTLPAGQRRAPLLNTVRSTGSTVCFLGDCANARILAVVDGVAQDSWIAVEWQNALGTWRPVRNWEGLADYFDLAGRLHKHWDVSPAQYGQGPFRWAIYSGPNGDVLGVSPDFYLPTLNRQVLIFNLTP